MNNLLFSLSLIILIGFFSGYVCKKIKLPPLIGMIFTGILLGPYVLGLIDSSILNISAEIRKIALIIILTRAGLTLDISDLKKIGRPAFLMCFIPATVEIGGSLLIGHFLLKMSLIECAIMGAVLAAVSPAVVVPRMIKLIDEGYGKEKGIPQLILAGASVDDIYVIVLFTTFISMAQGKDINIVSFVNIPVSIILGIAIGYLCGYILSKLFMSFDIRDMVKALIMMALFMLLTQAENALTTPITFSSLIAIMFTGIGMQKFYKVNEKQILVNPVKNISKIFDKLWIVGELFLFVLVGAIINIDYLKNTGLIAVISIVCILAFRMLGVFICLIGTSFNNKEKLFSMLAYTPKATVQAAIGSIPLSIGLACGDMVLTVAVIAIVLTAPVGAFMIDFTYKKLLIKN